MQLCRNKSSCNTEQSLCSTEQDLEFLGGKWSPFMCFYFDSAVGSMPAIIIKVSTYFTWKQTPHSTEEYSIYIYISAVANAAETCGSVLTAAEHAEPVWAPCTPAFPARAALHQPGELCRPQQSIPCAPLNSKTITDLPRGLQRVGVFKSITNNLCSTFFKYRQDLYW